MPSFQDLTLPIMRLAADGDEHALREAYEALADEFGLSEEERKQLLPSGTQRTFENRVSWARFYLVKAEFLEAAGRGRFRITPRGQEVLRQPPERIDIGFLEQFDEFREFRARRGRPEHPEAPSPPPDVSGRTPQELMEETYQDLREELAEQLLDRVKSCSPEFFERLVVELLVAMGYGGSQVDAGKAVGRSGDGGVDGIIKEDKLGLDAIYLQAKRWEGTVGRPVVQAFAGSLEGYRAKKGVLITTSRFSDDARQYVGQIEKRIVLIDGDQLAQLMIEHEIGVTKRSTYVLHRLDQDYFGDGE